MFLLSKHKWLWSFLHGKNSGYLEALVRKCFRLAKRQDLAADPCPLDLWPIPSRPRECSSCGPSAQDIQCYMKGPPKRGSGQARTAHECASTSRARARQRAASRKKLWRTHMAFYVTIYQFHDIMAWSRQIYAFYRSQWYPKAVQQIPVLRPWRWQRRLR